MQQVAARVSEKAKETTKTLSSKDWLKKSIDASTTVDPAWLTHHGSDVWVRMRTNDEQRLNAALDEGTRQVPVSGGRWEAEIGTAVDNGNVWAGAVSARYYDLPPRQLARSVWCYRSWPNGQWLPFAATDDTALEQTLQDMATPAGSLPDEAGFVTVDGLYRVALKRQPNMTVIPTMSAVNKRWLSLGTTYTLSRGWAGEALPRLSPEEHAAEESPPVALALVVHGIGETFFSKANSMGIKALREGVDKFRSLAAASSHGARAGDEPAGRVEFLPVEWNLSVRDDADGTMSRMRQVTPTTVPLLRQFANEVVLDVLFYEHPAHRQRIQARVAHRVNELLRLWRQHNPGFEQAGGRVQYTSYDV